MVCQIKKGDLLIHHSDEGFFSYKIREINNIIVIVDGIFSMKVLTPDKLISESWWVKKG